MSDSVSVQRNKSAFLHNHDAPAVQTEEDADHEDEDGDDDDSTERPGVAACTTRVMGSQNLSRTNVELISTR